MKNRKVIWGVLLVIIAIVLMLYILDIITFNLFFKGWWTLIIIIPSFICLCTSKGKKTPFVWLVIGVLLLLCARGILDYNTLIKLIIPVVLLVIGLSLIIDGRNTDVSKKIDEINDTLEPIASMFQDDIITYEKNEEFKNSSVDVVFGSLELDLRNAKFDKEMIIKSSTIFGITKIDLPDNTNVVIRSRKIFGTIDNIHENNDKNKNTLYIDVFVMFGGLDIE